MNIGLVYDLRDDYLAEGYDEQQVAEFDRADTIDAIDSAVRSLGHRTDRIGNAKALCRRLVAGDRWNLVFNVAEGLAGRSREAQVPAILELYGIPYTFSDPLVCAATLDKAVAKRILQSAGLATPRFATVASLADLGAGSPAGLRLPLFAKPIAEGTGKGVDGANRIDTPEQLRAVCARLLEAFHQPVLVEEYLPGREFTTAVLGTGAKARVLGTMEIRIRPHAGTTDYSYKVKEECEELVEYTPMPHGPLRRDVEKLVLDCYRALECRDVGRIDVRLDADGRPAFIEVNPLPGMHPHHSDLPMIATQEGMTYNALVGAILASAMERMA